MIIDLFADKTAHTKTDISLTDETKRIVTEIKKAKQLFNEVTDPYEIEAVIYRLKELELHYSFLIKEAKLNKICSIEHFGGDKI